MADPDALIVLLPLLIVLSTFLFILLTFLICALVVRRRRGIVLSDNDGPVDMSREELVEGDGGFDLLEARYVEGLSDAGRRVYARAKEYQLQYPPNSLPTDITLSQFLSIQEKGVSAWAFEPDYEALNSLLVHARTEITFLPDPASASCVQSNLPLPKLNEVYYWEVKMFDLPPSTNVAVGLATKPYPSFRMPGHNRYSVAYHSSGEKCYNHPFTASQFGPLLKEGDVLGVGYRPRTGTVFFTRNGRKTEDAFVGLSRWNLFPSIGADGPCSVHVNFGQAGFVFIEANVKKWGLAPSVGTLAPPPAYGSERGSILLDVGGRSRLNPDGTPSSRRSRRARNANVPVGASPLRTSHLAEPPTPITPPPPITPIEEDDSGSDDPSAPLLASSSSPPVARSPPGARNPFTNHRHQRSSSFANSLSVPRSDLTVQLLPPPDSPLSPNPNPPTPGLRDIHLQALSTHRRSGSSSSQVPPAESPPPIDEQLEATSPISRRDPPAYSPLDAYTYADGVQLDLPADVIQAALEGGVIPSSAVGRDRPSERRRSTTRRR